ncbi:hypothetical protein [Enterovibrio calviensis]|uniref:hypothetical protein n=1 Tax=Enterovibrio calviensis TaxID=91359 RepID=UPI0004807C98|nr:hypothetical protein [Enterovibrio calviensis]
MIRYQTFEQAVDYHLRHCPQRFHFYPDHFVYKDFRELVFERLKKGGWPFDAERSEFLHDAVIDYLEPMHEEWKETGEIYQYA